MFRDSPAPARPGPEMHKSDVTSLLVQELLEGAVVVGCLYGVIAPDVRALHKYVRDSGLRNGQNVQKHTWKRTRCAGNKNNTVHAWNHPKSGGLRGGREKKRRNATDGVKQKVLVDSSYHTCFVAVHATHDFNMKLLV